jgi:outer membrane protein TolC
VGIPAQLLCRRPDVRVAQFNAAAQAEQIGIAMAQFYPSISINGTINYQAQRFADLFKNTAFGGSVGPSFTWDILNYGRLLNNVRFQDATFQELLLTYRNTVLAANQDVENSIVTFLRSQEAEKLLYESVVAAEEAKDIVIQQYQVGARVAGVSVDFNRVSVILQALVTQQNLLAQARGNIALGLVSVYRSLGGGWEMRLKPQGGQNLLTPPAATQPPTMIPVPALPTAPPLQGIGAQATAPDKNAGRKDLPMPEAPVVAPLPVPELQPDRKPLP